MIRQIIALCAFLMLSGAASAGYVSAGSSGAYRTAGGSSTWTGAAGTVSGGAARTIESLNIGGKYIGVPTLGPIAAGAAEVLIGVIQRSPTAVAITAAPWLLTKGIELIDGQWMKQGNPIDKPSTQFGCWQDWANLHNAPVCSSGGQAVCDLRAQSLGFPIGFFRFSSTASDRGECHSGSGSTWGYPSISGDKTDCPVDYHASAGACFPDKYEPVGDSDWAKFRGEIPPDAVLNDLCKRLQALGSSSYGCPVTGVNISPITAALTDWKLDPNTGVATRQVVKLTPSPSDDDATRMAAELVTETKTSTTKTDPATGETTTEESTTENPTENPDFCILHPESMACAKLGEPGEAPDLQKKDISVSLQPDSGFGPDNGTCPADRTYTTHNGGIPIVFSWAPVCQGATTFRPVVIGMAWLSAVLIFMGITKRSAS